MLKPDGNMGIIFSYSLFSKSNACRFHHFADWRIHTGCIIMLLNMITFFFFSEKEKCKC